MFNFPILVSVTKIAGVAYHKKNNIHNNKL